MVGIAKSCSLLFHSCDIYKLGTKQLRFNDEYVIILILVNEKKKKKIEIIKMQCIQNYGNSSSDSESDDGESKAHLKLIDTKNSVAKSLTVVAAPDVVPLVRFYYNNPFSFQQTCT